MNLIVIGACFYLALTLIDRLVYKIPDVFYISLVFIGIILMGIGLILEKGRKGK